MLYSPRSSGHQLNFWQAPNTVVLQETEIVREGNAWANEHVVVQ
jgi:hypothetical protein